MKEIKVVKDLETLGGSTVEYKAVAKRKKVTTIIKLPATCVLIKSANQHKFAL